MSVKATGIVKFTLDPNRSPKVTKKERARLAGLADEDIDLTDIPATYGVAWSRPGLLIPEANKRQITLRIDADLLAFFKSTGARYQTRMNQVFRSYMAAQRQTDVSQKAAPPVKRQPEIRRLYTDQDAKKPTGVNAGVKTSTAAVARTKRAARDIKIINREAKRLNKEARDVLGYQRLPWSR